LGPKFQLVSVNIAVVINHIALTFDMLGDKFGIVIDHQKAQIWKWVKAQMESSVH
jgi:hypothetical protein